MQIDYDPHSDALYIRLREGQVDDTIETSKYVYVDVDEDGIPLGIEHSCLLDACSPKKI
ncbi:MAG TPA: DUF2283 domain-containing protein [Anaerolineales bacterium]|nr:DUF2283 domain-containing protein [Anaerolineales bacterium]